MNSPAQQLFLKTLLFIPMVDILLSSLLIISLYLYIYLYLYTNRYKHRREDSKIYIIGGIKSKVFQKSCKDGKFIFSNLVGAVSKNLSSMSPNPSGCPSLPLQCIVGIYTIMCKETLGTILRFVFCAFPISKLEEVYFFLIDRWGLNC